MSFRRSAIPDIAHISEHGSEDDEEVDEEELVEKVERKRKPKSGLSPDKKRQRLDEPPSSINSSIRSQPTARTTPIAPPRTRRTSPAGRRQLRARASSPDIRRPQIAHDDENRVASTSTSPFSSPNRKQSARKRTGVVPKKPPLPRQSNGDFGEASDLLKGKGKYKESTTSLGSISAPVGGLAKPTTRKMKRTREEKERRRSMVSASDMDELNLGTEYGDRRVETTASQGTKLKHEIIEISSDESRTPPPSARRLSSSSSRMPAPTSKPSSSKLPGKKLFPTPNTNVRSSSDSDIHVVGGRIAPRPSRLSSSKAPTSSSKPHSRPKGPQVGDEVIVLSDEENDVDAGMGTEKDGEPGSSSSASALPPRRRGSVINVKKEKETPSVKIDRRVGSDVIVISDSDSEGVPLARDTGRGKSSKGKEKAKSPSSPHPRPRSYSDFWGSLSRGDSEQVGGPAVGPETDEERSIPDEDRNGAEERKGKEKERAIGSVDPNVDESRQETPTSLRSGPEKGQRLSEVPESPPPTENEVVEDTSVDETNVPDDLPEEVGGDTEDMDVHMEVDVGVEQSVPGPEELRAPSDSGAEPKEEQTQTNGIDVRVDMVTDSPPGAETGEEQPQTDSIDVGVHMVTNPLLEAAGLDSSLPESPQPVLDRSSQENLSISSPIKELPTRKPKTSSSLPLSYEQQMAQAYASLSQPSDDTGSKRTSSTGVGASASPTLSSSLSTPTLRSSATPSTVPTKMGPSRSSSIISGSGSASSSTRSSNRARKSTGKSGLPIYKIPIKNDPAADTSPSTSASADTSEIGVGRNNPLIPRPSSSNSHAKASVRGSRYARSPLGPQKSAQDKLDQDHEEVDVSATRRRSTSSQVTTLEQSGTVDLVPPPSRRSSSSSIRSGETSTSVPRPASAQNKPQSLTDIYNRLEDAYNADATNVQSLTATVRKLNVSSEGDTPPPIPVPAKNKSRPSAGAIQRLALVRELMKSSSKGKGNVQVQATSEPYRIRGGEEDYAKTKETAESDAMAVGQSVADEDHQMSTETVTTTSLQLGSSLMDQSEPTPDESSVQGLDRRLLSKEPGSLSAVQEQVQELASTSVSISGWIDEPLEYADSPSPMDQDEVNEEERVSAELMCHSSGTSDSTISPVEPVVTHQIINTSSSTAIHTELVVDAPLPQVPVTEEEITGRPVRSRTSSEIPLRRSRRNISRDHSTEVVNMTPQETPPRSPSPEDDVPKFYGGLPVMTWKSYRENLRNSTPEYHLARDLPHKFQDHINFMSELARKYPQWSKNFEIMVAEANAQDEPDAPPITLFNEVDDEPAPPWEFHYTNKMWLGENVPPPSYKALKSCGCVGKCDPKSKTCECVKRQEELTGFYQSGFLYEKNGLLKQAGLPILECNSLCGCDEDCMNRVVQNGRKCDVSVGKTREKGWGVFNGSKEIPRGTFIGIYAGELLADAVAEERGAKYNVFGRTYLFDIDFYYIKDMVKDWSGNSKYTVDAYHAGNFTRFLNHSCDPNAALTPVYIDESDWEKPLLTIFAKRNIPPWDEITFSYSGDPDNNEEEATPSPKKLKGKAKAAQNDAVYTECRCGSRRCKGTMFAGYDEDEPEDDEFS